MDELKVNLERMQQLFLQREIILLEMTAMPATPAKPFPPAVIETAYDIRKYSDLLKIYHAEQEAINRKQADLLKGRLALEKQIAVEIPDELQSCWFRLQNKDGKDYLIRRKWDEYGAGLTITVKRED